MYKKIFIGLFVAFGVFLGLVFNSFAADSQFGNVNDTLQWGDICTPNVSACPLGSQCLPTGGGVYVCGSSSTVNNGNNPSSDTTTTTNNGLPLSGEQVSEPNKILGQYDYSLDGIIQLITDLACRMLQISIVIIVIFIVWVGLKMMYAQADPKKFDEAKKSFFHVLIGALVIFAVYTIISTVAYVVGNQAFSVFSLTCR